jgi:NAD(P)H-dependent FMN reductase
VLTAADRVSAAARATVRRMSPPLRALGLSGSPRRNGNSTTLLRAALAGAEAAGAETALIRLDELTFRGCRACASCPPDGCRQRDGFAAVHAALALADVWLFASPVYFDGVSGVLKTCYDRLYWFRRQGTEVRPRLGGPRRGAILLAYEDPQNDYYAEMAQRLADYFPGFGGFTPGRGLACPELGPAHAGLERPEYLEAATGLGSELVRELLG